MRKKNTDSVITVPKLYTIKDVHDLFASWNGKYGSNMYIRHKKHIVEEFDGHLVKTWSQRYELFPTSTTCVCCVVGCRLSIISYKNKHMQNISTSTYTG